MKVLLFLMVSFIPCLIQAQIGGYDYDCQGKYQQQLEAAAIAKDKCSYLKIMLNIFECMTSPNSNTDAASKKKMAEKIPQLRIDIAKACNGAAGAGDIKADNASLGGMRTDTPIFLTDNASKNKEVIKAEEERLQRLREEELRQQKLLELRVNMIQLQQGALNTVRTQSQEILDRQRESLAEFKGKLFGKSITYSNPILDEGSQSIETTAKQKITDTAIDDEHFNGDSAEPIFSLPNAWKSLKEKDILGFFQGLGFTKPLNFWQNRGLETVDQVGNDLVKDYSSLMDRLFIKSNDLNSDQADVMVDDVFNKVKKNLLNIIPGLGDLWHSINK